MEDPGWERELDLRGEATACLLRFASGDRAARDELFEVVYSQLREQASSYLRREGPGHTLQSTALVHEAWLKLIDQNQVAVKNRGHFLALAAQAMRRILTDHARTKKRQKRAGARERLNLEEGLVVQDDQGLEDLLAIDQALEKLRESSEHMAKIVELRFFGALSNDEIAETLGISESTVGREWRAARAMMSRLLGDGEAGSA